MDKAAYFEQMRSKRRNEILSSARKLMLSCGPDAFNMQQLARSLDISTVTLYKYYKNSDDIVAALQQEILQDKAFLWRNVPPEETAVKTLLAFLSNVYLSSMENREDMTLLFLFDIHNRYLEKENQIENSYFSYSGTFYETLCQLLQAAADNNEIHLANISDTAHMIQNLFSAMIRQIALMDDSQWNEHKKELAGQLEPLLTMTRLYLV